MRMYRRLIDLPLILIHPHILPVIHPPLLHLSIEHLRVLLLPHLLPVLHLFKSLLLRKCINLRLLEEHLLDLDFILFLFIVVIDLLVETLMDDSPVRGLSLLIIDLTCLQLSQILLLVEVIVIVKKALLRVIEGLSTVGVSCHLIHILVVLLHS